MYAVYGSQTTALTLLSKQAHAKQVPLDSMGSMLQSSGGLNNATLFMVEQ